MLKLKVTHRVLIIILPPQTLLISQRYHVRPFTLFGTDMASCFAAIAILPLSWIEEIAKHAERLSTNKV